MRTRSSEAGFSLIEVAIALLLLLTVAAGLMPLMTMSVRAVHDARLQSMSAMLASQKLEQLRALCWAFDVYGVRVSDVTTDLSHEPFGIGGGGAGLSPSNSLQQPVSGFVDYLDRWGRWAGTGTTPPPAAAYLRRWSITAIPGVPDALLLQVLVEPAVRGRPVRVVSVVTRKAMP